MKKVFMVLGGIFLVIVVVIVAAFIYIGINGRALDKESQQYVDAAIPAIVSTWDKQVIIDRASPEFIKTVKGDDLDKLISFFGKLGKFKEYKGASGQANIKVTPTTGKVITAVYLAKAEFETGPAEITISLIKHGEQWQLLGFHINSKAFLE